MFWVYLFFFFYMDQTSSAEQYTKFRLVFILFTSRKTELFLPNLAKWRKGGRGGWCLRKCSQRGHGNQKNNTWLSLAQPSVVHANSACCCFIFCATWLHLWLHPGELEIVRSWTLYLFMIIFFLLNWWISDDSWCRACWQRLAAVSSDWPKRAGIATGSSYQNGLLLFHVCFVSHSKAAKTQIKNRNRNRK